MTLDAPAFAEKWDVVFEHSQRAAGHGQILGTDKLWARTNAGRGQKYFRFVPGGLNKISGRTLHHRA